MPERSFFSIIVVKDKDALNIFLLIAGKCEHRVLTWMC